jgi:hypothetical protein
VRFGSVADGLGCLDRVTRPLALCQRCRARYGCLVVNSVSAEPEWLLRFSTVLADDAVRFSATARRVATNQMTEANANVLERLAQTESSLASRLSVIASHIRAVDEKHSHVPQVQPFTMAAPLRKQKRVAGASRPNTTRKTRSQKLLAAAKRKRVRKATVKSKARRGTLRGVLQIATSQHRYREGRNNRTKFGRWYGGDGQPWCAMFVSWAFAKAGVPLPFINSSRGFASVQSGYRWAKRNGRWAARPAVGDVFFILHKNGTGHTGIVTRVHVDGTISTIEGNTNNRGSREGTSVLTKRRSVRSINGGFMRVVGRTPNIRQRKTNTRKRRR